MSKPQTVESFWSRVARGRKDQCWEWQGACNSTGYGNVSWNGEIYTAHRTAAWITGLVDTKGAPKNKTDSTHVLHKCDNRKCCNPNHFFLGSYGDNQRDAYNKNRRAQPKGEHHANAKLTSLQVARIRRAYRNGFLQKKLAEIYGVSQRTISLIVRGGTYA